MRIALTGSVTCQLRTSRDTPGVEVTREAILMGCQL
jgi:hypothetical protein